MKKNEEHVELDRKSIMLNDGVLKNNMNDYNEEVVSVKEIIEKNGFTTSWSHTLINTESNCATLIAQMPGEGNRLHYHPEWNEWWYILEGEWEWEIEGKKINIKKDDLVFMKKGRVHKITAKGKKMAIRLAVSKEDVEHIYPKDKKYNE